MNIGFKINVVQRAQARAIREYMNLIALSFSNAEAPILFFKIFPFFIKENEKIILRSQKYKLSLFSHPERSCENNPESLKPTIISQK